MKKNPAKKIKPSKSVPAKGKARAKRPEFINWGETLDEQTLQLRLEAEGKLFSELKSVPEQLRQVRRAPTTAELAQLAAALALRKEGSSFSAPVLDEIHCEMDEEGNPIELCPVRALAQEAFDLWTACGDVLVEGIQRHVKMVEDGEVWPSEADEAEQNLLTAKFLERFGTFPIPFDRALKGIIWEETSKAVRRERFHDMVCISLGNEEKKKPEAEREITRLEAAGFDHFDFGRFCGMYSAWVHIQENNRRRTNANKGWTPEAREKRAAAKLAKKSPVKKNTKHS
ncbi:MAG: hypothetical protein EXS29_04960 [Pedosphaera sp.]|nr:hypothetical protein [Pedosphaera sp.]